jgi:hypothetical protein
MPCPEYLRLRQHYEVAIRRWGQVLLSPQTNLVGVLFRHAEEINQKALCERDTAKERLDAHQ